MTRSRRGQRSESAQEAADLRLVAPAVLVWAGAWVGTLGSPRWTLVAACLVAVVLVVVPRRRLACVAALMGLLGGLLAGGLHAQAIIGGPVRALAEDNATFEARIVLLHDPVAVAAGPSDGGDGRQGRLWVRARVEQVVVGPTSLRVRAPVLITVSPSSTEDWLFLPAGSHVDVSARAAAPDRGSDLAAILRARGTPAVVRAPRWDQRVVAATHQGLRDAVADRSARARALVPALVVGDTSAVDAVMEERFRASGLLHVMAVSGSNLTLLLAFLLTAAKLIGVRGRWLYAVTGSGVMLFVLLCRTEPSVLRAAAMGVVALGALVAGAESGPRRGLRSLAVAALVLLLVDPWMSRSVGFLLSTSATAGIVLWASRWARHMEHWAPAWLSQALCVPLAAQMATGPTSVALSGDVSAVGLVANMAVGPLVGPATVSGFAAAGLAPVWPVGAELVAWPAALAAHGIVLVAEVAAAAPGATLWWPPGAVGIALLVGVTAVVVLLVPRVLTRRWLAVALAVTLVLLVVRGPTRPGWPPRGWDVAVCDVGQGNAVVLSAAPGSGVLVDTGGDAAAVLRCLRDLGVVHIPLLVLSHLHADHAGALPDVLAHLSVDAVLTAPTHDPETGAVPRMTSVQGDTIRVGEVTWQTLAPRPGAPPAVDSADENNGSLVGRASVGTATVLLPGDLEEEGQERLLRSGVDLEAGFLVVPHHGSRSQSGEFLRATGARVALVSVGNDNTYGHPHPRTLEVLDRLGMQVVRTDQRGDIVVVCAATCRATGTH